MRRAVRKHLALLPLVVALLFALAPRALAEGEGAGEGASDQSIEDGVGDWMQKIDTSSWDEVLAELPDEVRWVIGDTDAAGLIERLALTGVSGTDGGWMDALKNLFFTELRAGSGQLLALLALAVFSALVSSLAPEGGVQEAASFVLRCLALTYVLGTFFTMTTACTKTIRTVASFLELAFPALLTLLTAVGGTVSTGVLQPATALLTSSVGKLLDAAVLPLIITGGVLGMLDRLAGKARLGELAKLSAKTGKWLIGIVSTVFVGATSLRVLSAATFDGVSLKTAKYAASSLLPIVGGMVSGTMDTVLGCAALVRSAAGVTAMLVITAAMVSPLASLLSRMLLFRLAAAVTQPIADKKLGELYTAAADALGELFAVTLTVGLCFLITAALVIGVGNAGFLA